MIWQCTTPIGELMGDPMTRREELTDEQWLLIEPYFPRPRQGVRGRPAREVRQVMAGVLWVLRTGARWQDLPERFPPYQTCHRHFSTWVRTGVLEKVLKALTRHLQEHGDFDLSECFIDGSFIGAKKGALRSARPSGAKVRSSWQWQTAMALQSPFTLNLQARLKSASSRPRLKPASPKNSRSD